MTYCLSTCLKAHYLYIHLKPYTVLLFASRLIILILALSLTLSSHFLWDYLYIFTKTHYLYTYLNIAFTYVYWTVHHLDSWIKRDQLDVTCFIISLFNAQHVSDVNTPILRSLRLMCWVISWVVLICKDRSFCISALFSRECLVVTCVVVLEVCFCKYWQLWCFMVIECS